MPFVSFLFLLVDDVGRGRPGAGAAGLPHLFEIDAQQDTFPREPASNQVHGFEVRVRFQVRDLAQNQLELVDQFDEPAVVARERLAHLAPLDEQGPRTRASASAAVCSAGCAARSWSSEACA